MPFESLKFDAVMPAGCRPLLLNLDCRSNYSKLLHPMLHVHINIMLCQIKRVVQINESQSMSLNERTLAPVCALVLARHT